MKQKYNESVCKIKLNKSLLWVYCNIHPHSQAEKYCKRDHTLMCTQCAFENHSDHKGMVIEVKRSDIDEYMQRSTEHLERVRDRILAAMD